jgi:hypothetical protein
MRTGWILANIGEVRVKGYENPILGITDCCDFRIGKASKVLVFYRQCIMARVGNQLGDLDWEILVSLELHVDL